jgi:eukaryotic-like serine/threonine-protein kinase
MSSNENLVPGMVLGRYELLLPIAQGGMAMVWAARQKGSRGFQKTVAIKTMLPNLSDDAMFEQMFLDEAALAAKIHHPNVAEILDLGEQDEIIYLVMEWVDGEALSVIHKAARKHQSQIPYRIALRIASQACAGLHAAHELRDENDALLELVHRDVSPQNVLVTYDGIVKLVDFGVAKAANRAGAQTSAGQLKGKVPYMSPEQARGARVDRRTDIFAMGIVLYKLTTGQHPFMGETDIVTMRNIISRPLLPPRVKNPSYPLEVEQVLLKCLQKDPDKRYQTMLELSAALDRALGTLATVGMADDDIGSFVRTELGDRGARRRAALRDAVRIADERLATGQPPGPLSGASGLHEGVAHLLVTGVNSGIKAPMPSDPSSANFTPQPSQPSAASTSSAPQLIDSSQVAVEAPDVRRSHPLLFVGLGVATATAAIVFALVRVDASGSSPHPVNSEGMVAASPPPSSAPAARSTDTPSEVVPAATNSALTINDLPDLDDSGSRKKPGAPATSGNPISRTGGGPKAPPSKTATPAPSSTRPVSTQWVPTVQNPGF